MPENKMRQEEEEAGLHADVNWQISMRPPTCYPRRPHMVLCSWLWGGTGHGVSLVQGLL